jgi:hypothetical protein
MKRFDSEKEILEVIRGFENCSIARSNWRHAEHLTVALYYLTHHDFDTALEKMRAGLFNLLRAFSVDLTREMPYHETLTVFWMRTVSDFSLATNGSTLLEKANDLVGKFDKDYPLRFYDRDLLFSDRARSGYIEPSKVLPESEI